MTAIKTHGFVRFLSQRFIDAFTSNTEALYVAVGRVEPWANDAAPDTPVNTLDECLGVWNNMHFLRRVTGNDVSMVARRINWVSGTVYDAWAQNVDMSNKNFYVLTSDFNVYKCLENNDGAPSTIMPTYTSTSTTNRTADGYLWKYMYNVSRSQRLRFLTNDWMPVRTLVRDDGTPQWDVQESAVAGSIEAIRIVTRGNNFSSGITMNVRVNGDGTGAAANGIANSVTNSVQYLAVTAKGRDYTWANVIITSSNTNVANGATGEVIIGPFEGHGADPALELGVKGIIINARFKGDEGTALKVGNEYRQVALIRNPKKRSTDTLASNTIYNQVMTLVLSGSGGDYTADEWAYQGATLASATFKGRVVWFNENEMELSNTSGTIRSTTLTGATSSASRYVADYEYPPLAARSGDILYIDNRLPITRSETQTETLQIPIIF